MVHAPLGELEWPDKHPAHREHDSHTFYDLSLDKLRPQTPSVSVVATVHVPGDSATGHAQKIKLS